MLEDKPPFAKCISTLVRDINKAKFIVAYNIEFDRSFLQNEFKKVGKTFPDLPWIDPLIFVREFDKFQKGKTLTQSAERWGIDLNDAHRALADARATAQLLCKISSWIKPDNVQDVITQQQQWHDAQQAQYKAYRERNG